MPIEVVRGPDVPASHLPFSPALKAGGFIFVSGQASVDAKTGQIISDTFENEFRRSMENVQRILGAAGAELRQVVQVRSYVKDATDLPEYNRLYREYFTEPFPARTTITDCLGKVLFEIDVVAYVGA
ncbi:MAG TPA: RidA family protein [Tepidisphaeraceae bacterium]|nr:RidA family protein [Tepidisphaeraceae bacterium]